MPNCIAVFAEACFSNQAKQLAAKLNLTYLEKLPVKESQFSHYLIVNAAGLCLQSCTSTVNNLYPDFQSLKMQIRLKQATLRKELVAKAMGIHPRENPSIVDATAGLGRDSMILARLGYQVTMLERSPVVHALLEDALARAAQDKNLLAYVNNLKLLNEDAFRWLRKSKNHATPDIIYLDPMFPHRQKSALVKKEMRMLQNLLGEDKDFEELVTLAISCAAKRVVVKRPRLAKIVTPYQPAYSLTGKSSRFDIYLTR